MKWVVYFIIGAIGLFVLLGIVGAITDSTESEPATPTVDEVESTIEPITTPVEYPTTEIATPEPREWSTEELADCDISTLILQMDAGDQPTGTQLSDCEIAYFMAGFSTATTVAERLPPREKATVQVHLDNIKGMQSYIARLSEDRVIDQSELESTCFVLPQQETQLQEATDYIGSLEGFNLQGIEIDILKLSRLFQQTRTTCIELGELPVSSLETPNSLSTPEPATPRVHTPTPDWSNMTEEEIEAELSKNPCYHGKGPLGHIWDTECLVRQP